MRREGAAALVCGLLLLGVAGCASPAELQRQDEAACSSYGFMPGTSEFASCMQREALARNYGRGSGVSLGLGFGFGL